MCRLRSLLSASLTVAIVASQLRAAELTLADRGTTRYVVAVTSGATLPERHAATELSHFLKQVTGARFQVVNVSEHAGGPMLLVGAGPEAVERVGEERLRGLGQEGLVVESVGDDVVFTGGRPRGTLYAVYTFLEDSVGCRWYSPTVTTIPRRPTLVIPEQRLRRVPCLEYREPYCHSMFDADWALRNKVNGHSAPLDATRGGHVLYRDFVHSFCRLVPVDPYFVKHPEWFSELHGRRFHEHGQLCLTNERLKGFVAQRVIDWLRETPEADIVSVSQNDHAGRCECAKCQALEAKEGAPSGPLLHFVNAVAVEVEKEFPKALISTLAYRYSRRPPLHVRPRPNVIVRLCSIECFFASPLENGDCRANAGFARDLRGWSELCERLYLWDYVANYSHPFMPYPNLRVLGPNLRLFRRHGVKGVFAQGGGRGYGTEMDDLRAWVLAKLLWQPERDATALINEFVEGYYGLAAPQIRQYLDLTHDGLAASGACIGILSAPGQPFLSLDLLARAEALFDQAEEAVRHAPACLGRVQVARMPLRYVWCVRWDELRQTARAQGRPWPGPSDYLANAETLLSVAASNGITGATLDGIRKQVVGRGRRESTPPPGCEDSSPGEYLDVQEAEFWLGGRKGVVVTGDEHASDGLAVRIDCGYWTYANAVVYALLGGFCALCAVVGFMPSKAPIVVGLAALASGVLIALLTIGLIPDRAVPATELTPDLRCAVWSGITAILAVVLVSGAAVWFLLRKTVTKDDMPLPARRRAYRALRTAAAGCVAACALLFGAYCLGSAAHAIQGRRAMFARHRAIVKEGMGAENMLLKALRDVLAAAKKTVQRSCVGSCLDRLSPLDTDACDPSWAVSRPLCYPFIHDRGPIRCYAVVKCDLTGGPGEVFEGGLYDALARDTLSYRRVSADQVRGEGYQVYDLGCARLTGSTYLWIAPAQSRRAASAIWVDRLFAIEEPRDRATRGGSQGGRPSCASS